MMMIVINTVLDLSSLGTSHPDVWVLLMAEGHNVLEWMKWEVLLFNEKKKSEKNQVKKRGMFTWQSKNTLSLKSSPLPSFWLLFVVV